MAVKFYKIEGGKLPLIMAGIGENLHLLQFTLFVNCKKYSYLRWKALVFVTDINTNLSLR